MKRYKTIEGAAAFLAVVVLVSIVQNVHSSEIMLDGLLYILGAASLDLLSILHVSKLILGLQHGNALQPSRPILALSYLLAAWQMAIVGLLNIWAVYPYRNYATFFLSYTSTLTFVYCSAKVIQVADDPEQEGGAKPLNYFGRPRARILFLYGLCYLLAPIFVVGVRVFFFPRQCPAPFQPAEFSLLLITVFTVLTSSMVFQRYRVSSPTMAWSARSIVLTTLLAMLLMAIHFVAAHSTYVWVLSALNIFGILAYLYRLVLHEQRTLAMHSITLGPDQC